MQMQDGHERVIAYASRGLKDHEANYGAFLLEMAAAVFGIEHFDTYLVGVSFTLCIDHRPLETLSTVHQKTLNRLQQLMLEYDFTIQYRRGPEHVVPDCLSRNAVAALEAIGVDVGKLQRMDTDIGKVYDWLKNKKFPSHPTVAEKRLMKRAEHCSIVEDAVWTTMKRTGRNRRLLWAPPALRRVILTAAHVNPEAGHGGVNRTTTRTMLDYWWPNMKTDVERFVKNCDVCQGAKASKPKPSPLQPLPVPTRPNHRVHIDLFGPLRTSENGHKLIMVMTDAFSKYTEMVAIMDKSAETVAKAFLERWICRFSAPTMIVTDQGKEFCNKILRRICELWEIDPVRTTPFQPQTNAAAESYNRTIIKYMRAMIKNNQTLDWECLLPMAMLAYNTHVHRSTGETPFFLTFLHDPRLPTFDVAKPRSFYNQGWVEDAFVTMESVFNAATQNMREATDKWKRYFDKATAARHFKKGDKVLIHFPNVPVGQNQKFYVKWRPFTVIRPVGRLNVYCQPEIAEGKPVLVHVDRVVLRTQAPEEVEQQTPTEDAPAEYKGPRTRSRGATTAVADAFDEEEILEARLRRLRLEEEEWLDDSDNFRIVRRNEVRAVKELDAALLTDGANASAEALAEDDERKYDPWYSLGRLIWGERHTRSKGPVEDLPLPERCLAYKQGNNGPSSGSSASSSSSEGATAQP